MNPLQRISYNIAFSIEKLSTWIGHLVSWLTFLMVLVVFVVVIMRYLFNMGSIELQESIIYLHGMVFLLAAAFTLQQDQHVRVDVFYGKWNDRKRAWVDLLGTILLLFPVSIYIFTMSLDFVLLSWKIGESSSEAGGLPGLYLLKSLILIMPILLMLQGLAWIIYRILFLSGHLESPYKQNHEAGVKQ